MKKSLLSLGLSFALSSPGLTAATPAPGKPQLGSFGIDLANRDTSVKPGDNFDRYANGLARVVLAPPFPVPAALELLRSTERTGVAATIRLLDG